MGIDSPSCSDSATKTAASQPDALAVWLRFEKMRCRVKLVSSWRAQILSVHLKLIFFRPGVGSWPCLHPIFLSGTKWSWGRLQSRKQRWESVAGSMANFAAELPGIRAHCLLAWMWKFMWMKPWGLSECPLEKRFFIMQMNGASREEAAMADLKVKVKHCRKRTGRWVLADRCLCCSSVCHPSNLHPREMFQMLLVNRNLCFPWVIHIK